MQLQGPAPLLVCLRSILTGPAAAVDREGALQQWHGAAGRSAPGPLGRASSPLCLSRRAPLLAPATRSQAQHLLQLHHLLAGIPGESRAPFWQRGSRYCCFDFVWLPANPATSPEHTHAARPHAPACDCPPPCRAPAAADANRGQRDCHRQRIHGHAEAAPRNRHPAGACQPWGGGALGSPAGVGSPAPVRSLLSRGKPYLWGQNHPASVRLHTIPIPPPRRPGWQSLRGPKPTSRASAQSGPPPCPPSRLSTFASTGAWVLLLCTPAALRGSWALAQHADPLLGSRRVGQTGASTLTGCQRLLPCAYPAQPHLPPPTSPPPACAVSPCSALRRL